MAGLAYKTGYHIKKGSSDLIIGFHQRCRVATPNIFKCIGKSFATIFRKANDNFAFFQISTFKIPKKSARRKFVGIKKLSNFAVADRLAEAPVRG